MASPSNMKISFLFLLLTFPLNLALQVGFYSATCPRAESIIQQAVQNRFQATKSVTAGLLRLHFHDCFVRGCDGSVLIQSTPTNKAEIDAGPNTSLREFALIDQIKSLLEAACPQTVSCADILALATRDAVALAGGPKYNIPTGRRDGLISRASEVNLPGPTFTVAQAQQSFSAQGMTLNDMIVLLGGHTVGNVHCNFFRDRITNFQGTGSPDPTMDPILVSQLQRTCGSNTNVDPTTLLDRNTSFVVDNEYYNQIKKKRGVLKIDQELALDPLSSGMVSTLAGNNALFGQRFASAMIKMGNIKVLQGTAGEIRKNCRAFNRKS